MPGLVQGMYADIHDRDQLEVRLSQAAITIISSGNDQTWQAVAGRDTNL